MAGRARVRASHGARTGCRTTWELGARGGALQGLGRAVNRDEAIVRLSARRTPWDMIVIGGGATGLGIALDAATRGYDTLLLERDDFAQATSSRSTKLLHGGVRYLRQGNLKLVMGALRERSRVLANAPHLSSEQAFIIPTYRRGESLYYGLGLGVYERLA